MQEIIKGMPDGAEAIQKNFNEVLDKTQGQPATFTDFADVAADMIKYSGLFNISGQAIVNAPFTVSEYIVQVIAGTSKSSGVLIAYSFTGQIKFNDVSNGRLATWHELVTTDDSGVITWKPGLTIKVGQLVTFSSLGDTATGMLRHPIFMAKKSHITSDTFPDSTSDLWQLVNEDSYSISYKVTVGFAKNAQFARTGKTVSFTYWDGADAFPDSSGYKELDEKIPMVFRPFVTALSVGSNFGSSIFQFKFEQIDNAGTIFWKKTGSPVGDATASWITNNGPEWKAGTPKT